MSTRPSATCPLCGGTARRTHHGDVAEHTRADSPGERCGASGHPWATARTLAQHERAGCPRCASGRALALRNTQTKVTP